MNITNMKSGSSTRNKRERFVGLAEKRVTRAIKDLRLIGNLSNKSNYTYTQEDVEKIIKTLQKEFNVLRDRFNRKMNNDDTSFKLQ